MNCKVLPLDADLSDLEVVTLVCSFGCICLCYRPPSGTAAIQKDYGHKLISLTRRLSSTRGNLLLLGDYNLPSIDWDLGTASTSLGRDFVSCFADSSLSQIVDKPTRGANILDLILISPSVVVDNVSVQPNRFTSDHQEFFNLSATASRPSTDWQMDQQIYLS